MFVSSLFIFLRPLLQLLQFDLEDFDVRAYLVFVEPLSLLFSLNDALTRLLVKQRHLSARL